MCPGTALQEPAPLPICQGPSKLQALEGLLLSLCHAGASAGSGTAAAQLSLPSAASPSPTPLQEGLTAEWWTPT